MKVYVDSRHRISGTNEDFVWQIPETVDIPDSWCYIDCVLVPNVFLSIRHNYNNKLYLKERIGTTDHYITVITAPKLWCVFAVRRSLHLIAQPMV